MSEQYVYCKNIQATVRPYRTLLIFLFKLILMCVQSVSVFHTSTRGKVRKKIKLVNVIPGARLPYGIRRLEIVLKTVTNIYYIIWANL